MSQILNASYHKEVEQSAAQATKLQALEKKVNGLEEDFEVLEEEAHTLRRAARSMDAKALSLIKELFASSQSDQTPQRLEFNEVQEAQPLDQAFVIPHACCFPGAEIPTVASRQLDSPIKAPRIDPTVPLQHPDRLKRRPLRTSLRRMMSSVTTCFRRSVVADPVVLVSSDAALLLSALADVTLRVYTPADGKIDSCYARLI
jgi:hypothetical protein